MDTTGNNLALNGSDTLFDVTQDILVSCPTAVSNGISYVGGGSGVGAGNMTLNTQQVSPMSRALKNTEYCGVNIDTGSGTANVPVQTTTQDLMVGLDGIALIANATNSCSNQLSTGGTLAVVDGSGTAVVNCPGCTSGTNNYAIANSLDVLRLVYGGMHHDSTFDCSGNVRRSLVKNWSSLFSATCASGTCSGGLTHAWRRSDLSGTTDAFVSLVGFGSRGIGTLSSVPGASKKTNPFCNSADATSGVTSFGGASDFSDLDPIRQVAATTDQVAQGDGTLGLVLPIFLPDAKVNPPTTADIYPTQACSVGRFDLVSTGNVHDKCPGGPSFLGQCFQPYFLNGTVHQYGCISKSNAHAFGTPSPFDGRAWNLPVKPASLVGAYQIDANGREMAASFFRIHTTTPATGSTVTCQNNDDTQQIGCLTAADPCSIGYAGREGAAQAGSQALAVNGIFPTDANIINLVTGGTPVYPLARRLYFASLVGFPNLHGGEAALAACYSNNNIVKPAIMAHNFVALPSPGIKCYSYDDAPLPGCGDSATVTNCGAPAGTQASFITNPY